MSKICELMGTKPLAGNRVSHAKNRTKHRQLPNLKMKKYFMPELGRSVSLKLSTRAIRSVEKCGGLATMILKSKDDLLSTKVMQLKSQLLK